MKNNKDILIKYRAIAYDNMEDAREYLEQMAEEGWMLEKISGYYKFIFRRCEPKKLRFAVELFVGGNPFDTYVTQSNEEYIEYCEKAGWHFICTTGGMDVFYTEDEDVPPIESDPVLKLETIKKKDRTRRVYVPCMFLIMGGCYLGTGLTINRNMLECSFFQFSGLLLWLFVLGIYIWQMISYRNWLSKAKKAVEAGENLPGHKTLTLKGMYVFFGATALIHSIMAVWAGSVYQEKLMYMIPLIWGICLLLLPFSYGLSLYAEKKKMGRSSYQALSLVIVPLVFTGIFINLILLVVLRFGEDNTFDKQVDEQSLAVFGEEEDFVRREMHQTHWGHFLVSIDRFTVEAYNAAPDPVIHTWSIDVYETASEAIHERLLREAEQEKVYRMLSIRFPYPAADRTEIPGAEDLTIYRVEENGEYCYLIYNETVIISARCDEALGAEQMQVIRETFM